LLVKRGIRCCRKSSNLSHHTLWCHKKMFKTFKGTLSSLRECHYFLRARASSITTRRDHFHRFLLKPSFNCWRVGGAACAVFVWFVRHQAEEATPNNLFGLLIRINLFRLNAPEICTPADEGAAELDSCNCTAQAEPEQSSKRRQLSLVFLSCPQVSRHFLPLEWGKVTYCP